VLGAPGRPVLRPQPKQQPHAGRPPAWQRCVAQPVAGFPVGGPARQWPESSVARALRGGHIAQLRPNTLASQLLSTVLGPHRWGHQARVGHLSVRCVPSAGGAHGSVLEVSNLLRALPHAPRAALAPPGPHALLRPVHQPCAEPWPAPWPGRARTGSGVRSSWKGSREACARAAARQLPRRTPLGATPRVFMCRMDPETPTPRPALPGRRRTGPPFRGGTSLSCAWHCRAPSRGGPPRG
jgi:hypothetical protein